jgi:hypothetical protein
MEGQRVNNEHRGSDGAQTEKGKKAKSKSKSRSKKSKKRSKSAKEDSGSQEVADPDSKGNLSVTDENATVADRVNGHDAHSALLEDLAQSAKKASTKSSKRKKSRKLAAGFGGGDHNEDEEDVAASPLATPDDLIQLPKTMKKAKKAKSRKLSGASSSGHQEHSDNPEEALLQPLTPAHQSHHPAEVFLEEMIPESSLVEQESVENRAFTSEVDQNGAQPLSEKALGKRKAVDEADGQSRKKRVRKSTSNQTDLRAMFQSQQPVNSLDDTHTQANTGRSDNQTDEEMPDEQQDIPFEDALLKASEVRKRRKRRLPIDDEDTIPSSNSKGSSRERIPRTPRSLASSIGTPSASTPKTSLTVADATAIRSAMENYRDFNNLTQNQVNELFQIPAQALDSRALWTAIYEVVPLVPRRNIQQFCRRNFHNYEGRGAWSEEQDEALRDAYQRRPNKWTEIGQELNRFPEDARDRWRNYLVCDGNMKKDVWDSVEVQQLRDAVEECIQAIRDERRQDGAPEVSADAEEKLIDWQTVSAKMNHTRSRLQCSYKWKRLKNFDGSDDKEKSSNPRRAEQAKLHVEDLSSADKLRFLRVVYESGATRAGKIPWAAISRELNETGKRPLWQVCIAELTKRLPGSEDMEFNGKIKRLVDLFEESAPDEPDGFDISAPAKKTKKKRKSEAKPKAKGSKAKELNEANGEGQSSNAKVYRKLKDRMRRQDESTPEPAETAGNGARAEMIDADEELIASLRSLKTAKSARRKSKPSKFLSEERIIDESSEEEDASNEQIGQNLSGAEHSDDDDAAEGPEAETDVESELDDQGNGSENGHLGNSLAAISNSSGDDSPLNEDEPHPESDIEDKPASESDQEELARESDNEDELAPESDVEGEPGPESGVEDEPVPGSDIEDDRVLESDDEDEPALENDHETPSVNVDEDHAITANGFDDPEDSEAGSLTSSRNFESGETDGLSSEARHDSNKTPYHRLANRHVETYFDNEASDSESSDSSDSSASSIPARVKRNTSIEL